MAGNDCGALYLLDSWAPIAQTLGTKRTFFSAHLRVLCGCLKKNQPQSAQRDAEETTAILNEVEVLCPNAFASSPVPTKGKRFLCRRETLCSSAAASPRRTRC